MFSTLAVFVTAVSVTANADVPKSTVSPSVSALELAEIVEKLDVKELRNELRAARRIDERGRQILRERANLRGNIDLLSRECEEQRSVPEVQELLGKWKQLEPELNDITSKPTPREQGEAMRDFRKRHSIKLEVLDQIARLRKDEQVLEQAKAELARIEKALADHVQAGGPARSSRRSPPVGGGARDRLLEIIGRNQSGNATDAPKDSKQDGEGGNSADVDLVRKLRETLPPHARQD